MSKLTKFIYVAIGLWVVSTLSIHAFGSGEKIWILRGFWPWLSLLTAAVLTLLCVIALFINKPRFWAALAILLVALTMVLVFETYGSWGARIHFQIYKSRYETIVRQVLATSTEEERKKICADDCRLFSSEPARVAFHYAFGFNYWHNIIYDPTGKVSQPDRSFDRYLLTTDHLTGDWFFCHFVD